jgi:hypothetical protein
MIRFNKDRRITLAESELKGCIFGEIGTLFPGIFELLMHPERWSGDELAGHTFPIRPEKTENVRFIFEVFRAPLPFAACCIKIPCECGMANRLVVLNSTFLVVTSHLLATSLGTGFEPQALGAMLSDLRDDPLSLSKYRIPDGAALPRDDITAGIAWLLFHEFGHVVGGQFFRAESLDVPAPARGRVAAELDADHTAFLALHHRCLANSRLRGDLFPILLCGIEIVLRSIAAFSRTDGKLRTILETNTEADYGHPSSLLRWNTIRTRARRLFQIGMWDDADRTLYRERRKLLLCNYNRTISAIRGY